MTHKFHLGQFCVYAHESDGVIFYVGSGNFARAHSPGNRGRQYDVACDGRNVSVTILSVHDTRKDAYAAEWEHIQGIKPAGNIVGASRLRVGRPPEFWSKVRVKALPSGNTFDTAAAAGRYYGITGASVGRSIKLGIRIPKAGQRFIVDKGSKK